MKKMADKTQQKPEYVWGAIINLGGGLHSSKPRRYKLCRDDFGSEYPGWWRGDTVIDKLGFYYRDGFASFASVDKREVELFCLGASTVCKFITNWAAYGAKD